MDPQVSFNPKFKFYLFVTIIILFSLVSMAITNAAFIFADDIYHGVTIAGMPVGGMTREEAEQLLQSRYIEKTKNPPLSIIYKDTKWSIAASDIDLEIDSQFLANQAYDVGRKGSFLQKYQERYRAIYYGYSLPLKLNYNQYKLQAILNSISQSIERECQNASLRYDGSTIKISPAIIGRKVDIPKNLDNISANLSNNFSSNIELIVNDVNPEISTDDLSNINGVLAAYTTQFDPGDKNRTKNIVLAARSIDSIIVRPGQIFSFNANVGPRLAQYGYKEAPVFIDGKLVPDWGGGVCQVSSTLYNATLLADMSIEERTSHFRPPGYVPLGQDATVADNQLDFKFQNTSSNNIFIKTEMQSDELTVIIFGKLSPNMPDIRIITTDKQVLEPKIIVKQDDQLELGKEIVEVEGQKGYQVTTYRVKSRNGMEISREYLAFDDFKPSDRVIKVGTRTMSRQKTK